MLIEVDFQSRANTIDAHRYCNKVFELDELLPVCSPWTGQYEGKEKHM